MKSKVKTALALWFNVVYSSILKTVKLDAELNKGINSGNIMTHPSKELQAVANYFLISAKNESRAITNKQLQKLAYYAQAWNLVFNGRQKMYPEPIEAWVHGPAIRSLYNKYKKFGYMPIIENVSEPTGLSSEQMTVLKDVWYVYGKYDGDYLELLTHSEQPWIEARGGVSGDKATATVITDDSMYLYYKSLQTS